VLYEYPKRCSRRSASARSAYWYVTNPNLGASVDPDFLERKLREAEFGTGEDSAQGIYAKHFNVEIGLQARIEFMGWRELLGGAGARGPSRSRRAHPALRGGDRGHRWRRPRRPAWALHSRPRARNRALALLGASLGTRDRPAAPKAGCAEVARSARRGQLTIVKSPGQDVQELAQYVKQVFDAGFLDRDEDEREKAAIGVDPVGIGAVLDELAAVGIPRELVLGISQGYRMTGAVKEAERRLGAGDAMARGARAHGLVHR
jgi:phage terminase large subunit-like protein